MGTQLEVYKSVKQTGSARKKRGDNQKIKSFVRREGKKRAKAHLNTCKVTQGTKHV